MSLIKCTMSNKEKLYLNVEKITAIYEAELLPTRSVVVVENQHFHVIETVVEILAMISENKGCES